MWTGLQLPTLNDRRPDPDLGHDLRQRDDHRRRTHDAELGRGEEPAQGHEHEQLDDRLEPGAGEGPEHPADARRAAVRRGWHGASTGTRVGIYGEPRPDMRRAHRHEGRSPARSIRRSGAASGTRSAVSAS